MDYLGWYVWLSFIHTKQVTKTCRCQDPGFMPLKKNKGKFPIIQKYPGSDTTSLETHKWSPCVLALLTSGFFALFRLDGLWEPLWHKEALGELEKGRSRDSVNLLATYRFECKLFAYPVPFMIYDSIWYPVPFMIYDTIWYHHIPPVWIHMSYNMSYKIAIVFSKCQYEKTCSLYLKLRLNGVGSWSVHVQLSYLHFQGNVYIYLGLFPVTVANEGL